MSALLGILLFIDPERTKEFGCSDSLQTMNAEKSSSFIDFTGEKGRKTDISAGKMFRLSYTAKLFLRNTDGDSFKSDVIHLSVCRLDILE